MISAFGVEHTGISKGDMMSPGAKAARAIYRKYPHAWGKSALHPANRAKPQPTPAERAIVSAYEYAPNRYNFGPKKPRLP